VAARQQRDVKIRILSEYYDAGSKAAERAQRRLASLQMAAAAEDVQREAQKAAAVAAANAAQADAMRRSGQVMLGITAAVAVGLGLATKASMDWQSAFTGVRKVVDGSPEEISQLERELRGLAQVLPATHEQIAGVAEVAGQLGVRRQDVAEFTRTAINMGETTNMAADEAATAMAQLSNIMGIGADKADEMGSAIVALGNDGASTEQDIVSMALRIAGAGRTVGLTADQVLAIASGLSSVGLEVEAGGTAISRVLIQIDKDVRGGADTLTTYAQVSGTTVEAFKKQWQTDAAGALTGFLNGLGRMQTAGGDTTRVLDTLGFSEVRVTDAMRRAAYAGELLNDALETGKRGWAENNALTEEASRRYETAEARLATARNRLNDVAIDIGANFLPVMVTGGEMVADLADGFRSLPEPLQDWTVKLGTAATGLLGVVGGAALVIPKLGELKKTLDALQGGSSMFGTAIGKTASFLTGPWGLALAGAVVAGGWWLQQQGEMRRNVQALTDTLDEQTGAITENTREKTVARLQERGMLEAAAELGIELDRVTDAALGNKDAIDYVAQASRDAVAAEREHAIAAGQTGRAALDASQDALYASEVLERGLVKQRGETEAARHEWELHAEALGRTTTATDGASGATSDLNADLTRQAQLAEDAQEAIDDLSTALDDLNGPTLNAREAERRWAEQLDKVREALEANGATLDVNTEKGRENQDVLDGLARAGIDRANAVLEQTGSLDDYNRVLGEQRTALTLAATQYGLTAGEAQLYVDAVLGIPDTATTQAILDTVEADRQLAGWKSKLAVREVKFNPMLPFSSQYYMQRASGSIDFFRDGAIRPMDRVAQMVPPGSLRVVGDRSDVPELFAPLDYSARSRSLWETAGSMMGWGPDSSPVVVQVAAAGAPAGPVSLSTETIRALGVEIGREVLAGAGAVAGSALTATARDAAGRRSGGGWG